MKTPARYFATAVAVAIILASYASANPIDTDNDEVLDDVDACPNTPGSPHNFGCPSSEPTVTVTGTHPGWITCPWGTSATDWTECPTYPDGWGTFHVVYFSTPGHYSHAETLADEDGDGVYDDPDQCPNQKGPSYFDGCPASVHCASEPNMYEQDCYKWKIENLSTMELGTYFDGLRSFAEGGCGGDYYHWACYLHNSAAAINNSQWQDPVWLQRWADLLTPPNCPTYYYAQGSMPTVGVPMVYTGLCVNMCRMALFQAGLLTVGAGSIPAILATTAGKAAVRAAGITLAGTAFG